MRLEEATNEGDEFAAAHWTETKRLLEYETFEVFERKQARGKLLSTKWVVTEKEVKTRARFVAREFKNNRNAINPWGFSKLIKM